VFVIIIISSSSSNTHTDTLTTFIHQKPVVKRELKIIL